MATPTPPVPPTPPAPPAPPAKAPFTFEGTSGTPFNINGTGFGKDTGQVTMGGMILPITAWTNQRIKGAVPKSVKVGEIVVQTAGGVTVGKIPGPTVARMRDI